MYNNYDRFASPSVMIEELGWEPSISSLTFHEKGSVRPILAILGVKQLSKYHFSARTSTSIHTFQVQHNCGTMYLFILEKKYIISCEELLFDYAHLVSTHPSGALLRSVGDPFSPHISFGIVVDITS